VRWPDRPLGIAARWGGVIGRTRVVVVWGCLTGRFDIAARCGGVGRVTLRWGAVGRDTPCWGGSGRDTLRCGDGDGGRAIAR
jgi:hypothetical protein